jgi:hypothetical protein
VQASSLLTLGLVQPYLVIQASITTHLVVELSLQDLHNNHRRVFLSTTKAPKVTALHASLPFHPKQAIWSNIVLDLSSLVLIL